MNDKKTEKFKLLPIGVINVVGQGWMLEYPEPHLADLDKFWSPNMVELFGKEESAWIALRTEYKNAGLIMTEAEK